MKKIRVVLALAAMTTMMVLVGGCSVLERTEESKNETIVAEVNGEDITLEEVEELLSWDIESLKEQYGEDYEEKLDEATAQYLDELRVQALEGLIEKIILMSEGEKRGILPLSEDEKEAFVEDEFEELLEHYGSYEVFQSELEATGYTEEEYREALKGDSETVIMIEELSKDAELLDEDVEEYYENNKYFFVKESGESLARHILFRTIEEAEEVNEKIISGEVTFEELFVEYNKNNELVYSEDATDEEKLLPIAEDLGLTSHTDPSIHPFFLQGLMVLDEGEVSEIVETSYGYHIIESTEITPTVINSFEEMEQGIRDYLIAVEKENIYLEKIEILKEEYDIVRYEERL